MMVRYLLQEATAINMALEYLIPFRDAGSENDTFGLTVWDCISGLEKGKKFGWIDLQGFNVRE